MLLLCSYLKTLKIITECGTAIITVFDSILYQLFTQTGRTEKAALMNHFSIKKYNNIKIF